MDLDLTKLRMCFCSVYPRLLQTQQLFVGITPLCPIKIVLYFRGHIHLARLWCISRDGPTTVLKWVVTRHEGAREDHTGPEVTRLIPEQRASLTGNCEPTKKANRGPGALSHILSSIHSVCWTRKPSTSLGDITERAHHIPPPPTHTLMLGLLSLNSVESKHVCLIHRILEIASFCHHLYPSLINIHKSTK